MSDPRPAKCCGVCPPIVGGGYDCTCKNNPRCPRYKRHPVTLLKEVWHLIKVLPGYIERTLDRFTIPAQTKRFMKYSVEDLHDVPVCGDTLARYDTPENHNS